MGNEYIEDKVTIEDVANALGISKSTVSRAISGKGRIGKETRERVLSYIKEHNYKPNPIAKGLSESKTYNICWVAPGDSSMTALPFFQRCMAGVVDAASAENYDILMGVVYDDNISHLKRIVSNHKVDGVILGRTLINDESIPYLIESKVPFVAIGSTDYKDVVQIDNDHFKACSELTSILIMKGIKKFALIGGDSNHVVNRTRREGFLHALKEQKIDITDDDIFMNCLSDEDVERATDTALRNGAECLMCMDDGICSATIAKLKRDEVSIPEDIKIASFYNSELLSNNQPTITALQYDPKELGINACKTLFDILNGIEVEQKVMLSYEVQLKSSTQ